MDFVLELVTLALLTLAGIANCGVLEKTNIPSCDASPQEIRRILTNISDALSRDGYKVVEGSFKVFKSDLFGANPGNPYVTYFHPGMVDSHLPIFPLKETSAVVFAGCTPKSAAYFSWRSYAFTTDDHLVFASLGDSLNNIVINTTAETKNSGGKLTAVVTTSDAGTYAAVGTALRGAGLGAVNLDAIPSHLLDMDHTKFIMLHRASVWNSSAEKLAYFAQDRPVLFVDAPKDPATWHTSDSIPNRPLPTLPLRPPGTGVSELSMPGVKTGLDVIHTAVVHKMTAAGYNLVDESTVYDLGLDGFVCLRNKTNCKGDNRDTHYLAYHDDSFAEDHAYVIIGTNSVETGKCTYTNLGLYRVGHSIVGNRTKLKSTNITADNRKFLGSAEFYGAATDKVFAYLLNRTCNTAFCTAIDETNVPMGSEWALAYRTYLEPATATAPKLSELSLPKVLKFARTS